MKGKVTLTNPTVKVLMFLYRYDVKLVSLHKFLRKPCYLRLRLLLLKKDDNSEKCHSRYFSVIFRTELSFIRVNISAFQIRF